MLRSLTGVGSMIIILGFDNTGKTTLAKRLNGDLLWPVVKSPGPVTYEEQEAFIKKAKTGYIYERFPLFEEMVYGPILRGRSNFDWEDGNTKRLKNIVLPQIIYCRPPREVIFDTLEEREHMEGVIEHNERLLAQFDEIALKLFADGWMVQVYDYTRPEAYSEILNIHYWLEGNR